MVIEELLERAGARLKRHKSGCLIAETTVAGRRTVLARTTSYMNESGRPIAALLAWYKIPLDQLLVVHDELDIPFNEVRIKIGGGTAGHNGIGSLVSHLGSGDFVRVRVGISRPGRAGATDHVLDEFSSAERRALPEILGRAADAVERILEAGPERAMNEINTRPPTPLA
jgi:PTH1 family peptidyl-tRNA hydrolase